MKTKNIHILVLLSNSVPSPKKSDGQNDDSTQLLLDDRVCRESSASGKLSINPQGSQHTLKSEENRVSYDALLTEIQRLRDSLNQKNKLIVDLENKLNLKNLNEGTIENNQIVDKEDEEKENSQAESRQLALERIEKGKKLQEINNGSIMELKKSHNNTLQQMTDQHKRELEYLKQQHFDVDIHKDYSVKVQGSINEMRSNIIAHIEGNALNVTNLNKSVVEKLQGAIKHMEDTKISLDHFNSEERDWIKSERARLEEEMKYREKLKVDDNTRVEELRVSHEDKNLITEKRMEKKLDVMEREYFSFNKEKKSFEYVKENVNKKQIKLHLEKKSLNNSEKRFRKEVKEFRNMKSKATGMIKKSDEMVMKLEEEWKKIHSMAEYLCKISDNITQKEAQLLKSEVEQAERERFLIRFQTELEDKQGKLRQGKQEMIQKRISLKKWKKNSQV